MKRNVLVWKVAIFVTIVLIAFGSFAFSYCQKHFVGNIFIEGVNCNGLTPDEVKVKIEKKLSNKDGKIRFIFLDETETTVPYEKVGKSVKISSIEKILKRCKGKFNFGKHKSEFSLSNYDYEIDEKELRKCLESFPSLQEENMQDPRNAYITIGDDGFAKIVKEVIGTRIDFEKAYKFVLQTIEEGGNEVNFNSTSNNNSPMIVSTDTILVEKMNSINNLLKAVINLKLRDGSIYTIDYNTTKGWIVDSNGKSIFADTSKNADITDCGIMIDDNLSETLNELQSKVQTLGKYVDFKPTNGENVVLEVDEPHRDKVDIEQEMLKLKEELESGKTINREPIYAQMVKIDDYVEIDLVNQTVYMYKDGNCIIQTPCVTGSVAAGHETPPGVFYLTFKEKNRYLQGTNNDGSKYKSYVNYWMPFNGGIGLHDATWRGAFGGNIYKTSGSHGCVNLPKDAAAVIYENITYDMPIIVH